MEFADFYARTRDDCLRAVLVTVGHRQVAEDLVAEAFAKAFATWSKVSRHPTPKAWVVRTALNLSVSRWRRQRREVVLDGHDARAEDAASTQVDDHVMALLLTLPRRQREVVALRIFLDLDTAQAAKVLGLAPGTVTAHLHRGLAALRSQLTHTTEQEIRR